MRARSKLLSDTRERISGGSTIIQQKDELKLLTKGEREKLLKDSLGKDFKICVPLGDILALKADLGETWYTLRKLKRYIYQSYLTLIAEAFHTN